MQDINWELRDTNSKLRVKKFPRLYKLRMVRYKLRIARYKLRMVRYKLRIARYKLRMVRYKLRIARYKLRMVRYKLRIARYKPEMLRRKVRNVRDTLLGLYHNSNYNFQNCERKWPLLNYLYLFILWWKPVSLSFNSFNDIFRKRSQFLGPFKIFALWWSECLTLSVCI